MKVTYDPERDGLRILFRDTPIVRSTHEVSGLILDYDNDGAVVGIELTEASLRMHDPRVVEFTERAVDSGSHSALESPGEPA